jgi:NAD-dependent DNA ligase
MAKKTAVKKKAPKKKATAQKKTGAGSAKKGVILKITAQSSGTDHDFESFYLAKQDLLVTHHTYGKAWVTLTWKELDQFKEDMALKELRSDLMQAEMDPGDVRANYAEFEGADNLEEDDEFQEMLEDEYGGDLFDYCLEKGVDPWSSKLPKKRKEALPESYYEADRIRIYDIEVAWDDGSADLFTFNPDLSPASKSTRIHRCDSEESCLRKFLELAGATSGGGSPRKANGLTAPVAVRKKATKVSSTKKKATRKKAAKKKAGTAKVVADKPEALKDKVVAFTGKLDRMQRVEAEQLARSAGATTTSTINAKVDFLVIGADGFTNVSGDKSSKQKKGEALAKEGSSIQVMSEKKFFALLEQIAQSPEHRFIRDFLKWKKG